MDQRQATAFSNVVENGTSRNELGGGPSLYALEARGLGCIRGSRIIFHDIDLAVAPGEIVGLLGSNGVGKTTLLRCLAGVLRPATGTIMWQGEPARSSVAARRQVGLLGHDSGLYPALTTCENLLFAARMCGIDRVNNRVSELLLSFGLRQQAQQPVGRLSRGMRQRLALARAVIHDPPILLLDEPFTSLDPAGRCWLIDYLRQLRQRGRAILLVTHEVEAGRCFADRLLCLRTHGLEATWSTGTLEPTLQGLPS